MKRRSRELKSGLSDLVKKIGIGVLFLTVFFSSGILLAQKGKKKAASTKREAVLADTLRAIISRQEFQFPIRKFFDEAMTASQISHRPVLAFDLDYVDPKSIYVRDTLFNDPEVVIYLTKNFELGVHDYSVDPPPSVGFDSLRNLGLRLDKLEKGYSIVSRPTAIIINPDGSEVERITDLEHYSGHEFIQIIKDYLAGKNTVGALGKEFWSDPKNLDKHKRYLERMMTRFDYDSIIYHYELLATNPNFGQTPLVMKQAAAEYAYFRFKQEGNVLALKTWLYSLDQHADSAIIVAGLKDLLEFYQGRKKVDSVAVYYENIFSFTNERDPDLLNNYAWDITNYSTRYDTALRLVNEAITKDSKNPNYYDTRALIDYDRKEYDAAIADAKLARKYSGKKDKAYFKERVEFFEKEKKRIESEGSSKE
jgi:hypothetical protein